MRRDAIEEARRAAYLAQRAQEEEEEDDEEKEDSKEEKNGKEGLIGFEVLKQNRCIFISEPVTPKLTQRVLTQLLWLDDQTVAPVKVFINTPGGSADDGFAIFDAIRMVHSPVTTICIGLNASAGTLILLGAPRERRFALPNARIMIHQPSGGGRGTARDIEITAEEILKLRARANELIAEETGQPLSKVEVDTDRDYWLSAKEAASYGLVSRIIASLREIE